MPHFFLSRYWNYLLEDGKNVVLVGDLMEDLIEKAEYATQHDDEMKCIAREAQLLSLTGLRQEDLICWAAESLVELSSKMGFVPTLSDDVIEIPDPQLVDESACTCTSRIKIGGG
jgi:hypothetical protein